MCYYSVNYFGFEIIQTQDFILKANNYKIIWQNKIKGIPLQSKQREVEQR